MSAYLYLKRMILTRSMMRGIRRRDVAKRAIASHASSGHTAGVDGSNKALTAAVGVGLMAAMSAYCSRHQEPVLLEEDEDSTTTILNWSGTHAVHVPNDRLWEPETIEELEAIVKECHGAKIPVRPLGSALSPSGIAFHPGGMVSLMNLDKVLKVDKENMTVTVQSGARVSQVVEALRPHGMTLPNLASIAEQQMGGFVQVGAHGTGARIAPVDHYVTSLKLVTPGKGTIVLTEDDGDLFHLAKVGLGCLGVVAEVTMKCIPAHQLVEHTFVLTRKEAVKQLDTLLKSYKHVRYMWIPYEDAVVVVTNDPQDKIGELPKKATSFTDEERFRPLKDLLTDLTKDAAEPYTNESMKGMAFGELRDALLAVDPLGVGHVKRVNAAEAEFWRRSEGYQIKPSDELLQFDCGGQQWVWEVCIPTGTYEQDDGSDMKYMENLLAGIEKQGVAAPSPIEQRWSASSSSFMSPAHGPPNGLHSWIGIIMYLPSDDEAQRRAITNRFTRQYCNLMRAVGAPFNAASHWAKLERPHSVWSLMDLQLFLNLRYPLDLFNDTRKELDPKNILTSPSLNLILGTSEPKKSE